MSNFSGGSIPSGDKLRNNITSVAASTETTIFTRSGKGLVTAIIPESNNWAGNIAISSLKVTIDGAAERQLFSSSFNIQGAISTAGQSNLGILPYAIRYKTGCTIKITHNSSTRNFAVVNYEE